MIGNIVKIHSDFYYVKVDDNIIECKLRELLKKEHVDVYVGDRVKLARFEEKSNQAAIVEVLERQNHIPRPAIANIDQVIVVTTIKNPSIDYVQLNRYLTYAKIYNIPAVICVNKSDLTKDTSSENKLKEIYEAVNYNVLFTSALTKDGLSELKSQLNSKISVLCGSSGVGKSSLINAIHPDLHLKTKEISSHNKRGTHTTRHTEILNVKLSENEIAQVADTPGFSYLRFDKVMPDEIQKHFEDISSFGKQCHFSNCLHIEESGCNVLNNLDKIPKSRYESYKAFVAEALEFKEKIIYSGRKTEQSFKTLDTQNESKLKIAKLGTKAREKSRKNQKQKLNISSLEDAYYNNKEDL